MHCEYSALTEQLPELHATSTQLCASFHGREWLKAGKKITLDFFFFFFFTAGVGSCAICWLSARRHYAVWGLFKANTSLIICVHPEL